MKQTLPINKENKIKCFEDELEQFENPYIRTFTRTCISELPDYFFLKPSTSSGKYHSPDERGNYGLILHTKRVFSVLRALFRMEEYPQIPEVRKEYLMSAALLHDGLKYGSAENQSEHTMFEHPIFAAHFVKAIGQREGYGPGAEIIASYIALHMGQWNQSKYSQATLPKPTSIEQKVLHLADYMASNIPSVSLDDIYQFIEL